MTDDSPRLLTCRVIDCDLSAVGFGVHQDAPTAAMVPLCSEHE